MAAAGLAACAAALIVALGSEKLFGLIPCAFCLLERWPYRIGCGIAVAAFLLPAQIGRPALWLLSAVLLAGAGLSFVHAGVEQHWWPDPLPACTVPDFTGMSNAQRFAAMPLRPAKPCEDPDYLIPGVPVSMTQMGLIYALAVSAGLAMSLLRRERGLLR